MSYIPRALTLLLQAVFSPRYFIFAVLGPLVLVFGVWFNERLKALDRSWLEWSPFHVKTNIALIPISKRGIWLPYTMALALCMPFLALIEEWLFRAGTTNWVRGALWGSVAFGLFHLTSFVSIRMSIYLMIVGAILVAVYMQDGIVAVFVLHAMYNLTALGFMVATRTDRLRARRGDEAHARPEPPMIDAASSQAGISRAAASESSCSVSSRSLGNSAAAALTRWRSR
jgi:hypothetical protein